MREVSYDCTPPRSSIENHSAELAEGLLENSFPLIEPGDVAGMVGLLQALEQDRSIVYEAGKRGRRAFEKFYDRPIGASRILSILGLARPQLNT